MEILETQELEQLAEELGLSHPDYYRLEIYISLVRSYPIKENQENYYRENLAKWIEWEQESYFGQFDSVEEFTRHHIENYVDLRAPNWVVIDYAETWRRNLRHDFTEDRGFVWSDIY